jgi:hypothetical protein
MSSVIRQEIDALTAQLAAAEVRAAAGTLTLEERDELLERSKRASLAERGRLSEEDRAEEELFDAYEDVIVKLHDRVRALEARLGPQGDGFDIPRPAGSPTPRWAGLWDNTRTYQAGSLVCHSSSLFVAERAMSGVKPGAGASSGWRLIVKAPYDLRPRSSERGGHDANDE